MSGDVLDLVYRHGAVVVDEALSRSIDELVSSVPPGSPDPVLDLLKACPSTPTSSVVSVLTARLTDPPTAPASRASATHAALTLCAALPPVRLSEPLKAVLTSCLPHVPLLPFLRWFIVLRSRAGPDAVAAAACGVGSTVLSLCSHDWPVDCDTAGLRTALSFAVFVAATVPSVPPTLVPDVYADRQPLMQQYNRCVRYHCGTDGSDSVHGGCLLLDVVALHSDPVVATVFQDSPVLSRALDTHLASTRPVSPPELPRKKRLRSTSPAPVVERTERAWFALSPAVLEHIVEYVVSRKLMCKLALVCSAWRTALLGSRLWHKLHDKRWRNVICHHSRAFQHDWYQLYKLRHLAVVESRRHLQQSLIPHSLGRRVGSVKRYQAYVCPHCSCAAICVGTKALRAHIKSQHPKT